MTNLAHQAHCPERPIDMQSFPEEVGQRIWRLYHYNEGFIDPDLLEATRGFKPAEPDWDLASRQGVDELITCVAPEIYAFRFMTPAWCEAVVELSDLVDSYQKVSTDAQYAAPEVRLNMLSPLIDKALGQAIVLHVAPLMYRLWTIRLKVIHPPFVIRYTMETQKGMPAHHDNQSDATLSMPLNSAFTGGGVWFPRQNYCTDRNSPGEAILFPGRVTHRHMARAITSGSRYVLTVWTQ